MTTLSPVMMPAHAAEFGVAPTYHRHDPYGDYSRGGSVASATPPPMPLSADPSDGAVFPGDLHATFASTAGSPHSVAGSHTGTFCSCGCGAPAFHGEASVETGSAHGGTDTHSLFDGTEAEAPAAPAATAEAAAPEGTLHAGALWGRVSFVPYPAEEFKLPADARRAVAAPGEQLVRCFVGQLPYFVTDMQLAWLCYAFGGKHTVTYPERIMKRQPNGERLPTGCVHAYCTRQAVEEMASLMHKKLLIDDTGVWVAQTAAEAAALHAYVHAMKCDKHCRPPNRPYDSVVVQLATSTYVPKHVSTVPALVTAQSASRHGDVARPFRSRAAAEQHYTAMRDGRHALGAAAGVNPYAAPYSGPRAYGRAADALAYGALYGSEYPSPSSGPGRYPHDHAAYYGRPAAPYRHAAPAAPYQPAEYGVGHASQYYF